MTEYWVYIMTNPARTLYVGVSNDLVRRVYEHKNKLVPGFTARYNLTQLAYYEPATDVNAAIAREKQLKGWLRKKKVALIESANPRWEDLSSAWLLNDAETLRCAQGDSKGAQGDSKGAQGDSKGAQGDSKGAQGDSKRGP